MVYVFIQPARTYLCIPRFLLIQVYKTSALDPQRTGIQNLNTKKTTLWHRKQQSLFRTGKKLYGCTRSNFKQTEVLVKELPHTTRPKLSAPFYACLSSSADPVWMIIFNLLPGEGANSNSKYFQNIVTWSTTSRTLNGLVINCLRASFVAIVPTYLEKDKHKYAKSELSTASYAISLRYFLVLCVISAVLLAIINKFIEGEKLKNKCSDTVYGTFHFHIAWPVD